jgi:putative oxidoreductase
MKKDILHYFVNTLFLILFLYTALSKLLDYDKFVFQLRLAPVNLMIYWAPIIALVLPLIELGISVGLIFGFYYDKIRNKAIMAGIILLVVFEVYITSLLLIGSHLPCTCGGIISKMSWRMHLLFNAAFIIFGLISYLTSDQNLPEGESHKNLYAR